MNNSSLNVTTILEETRGWVKQSNDRGTLDIVISCGITTFLCIWTSVCVNVPAPEHGLWDIFRDRWHMFCLGMLGPEFIVLSAAGQFCSAQASVRAFRSSDKQTWTMRHAFFADMGGIHLQVPSMKSFPVNAKQLHFLVAGGYVPYPDISTAMINDKNKSDGLARFITTAQIFWFSLSTISRPFKQYAITTLELTTLGYIVCALATLFFWRHKPMDIQHPIVLDCPTPLDQIADSRGHNAAGSYHFTPLDFVSREEWITSRLWVYYVNLLRQMRIVHTRPRVLPIRRISSFNWPVLSKPMLFVILAIAFTYAGVFVAGWNLHYPTRVEKILWRTCSLGSMLLVIVGGVFEVSLVLIDLHKKHLARANRTPDLELDQSQRSRTFYTPLASPQEPSTKLHEVLRNIRNNTPNKDPYYDVPVRSIVITTPLCAMYTIFRAYILIEDFISLRELPASAFMAIEWSTYVPHI